jgi:hypothetical protein
MTFWRGRYKGVPEDEIPSCFRIARKRAGMRRSRMVVWGRFDNTSCMNGLFCVRRRAPTAPKQGGPTALQTT